MQTQKFSEEVKKAIPIVKDELLKYKIILKEGNLKQLTKRILEILYGKGGWFKEEYIKDYTKSFIPTLIFSIVNKELLNNNIKMQEEDMFSFTEKIFEISCNNGGGASEEEIKRITKQCIDNGLYKEFIGYSKKFYDRIMPVTDNK